MQAVFSLKTAARALFAILLVLFSWKTLAPDPNENEPTFVIARLIASLLFGDTIFADKVMHFGGYATLGFLAFFSQFRAGNNAWAAPAALALYGALLEGAQGIGGVRTPELGDALANGAGALAGFAIAEIAQRRFAKRA